MSAAIGRPTIGNCLCAYKGLTLALVVARSESLGYEFPDQVNPADFMMDIIGGDVHCERDPTLKHTDLPQKWIDDTTFSQREPSAAAADAGGDLADPKNREGATFEEQFKLFAKRALKQQFRPFSAFVTDCVLIYGAGACLGLAQKNTALLQLPMSSALPAIAVGLTTIISSTRNFGNERVVYWREAASGLNRVAYFLAKNVADIPRLLLIPIFYFIMVRPMAGLNPSCPRVSPARRQFEFTGVLYNNDTSERVHMLGAYTILLFAVWAVSGV